MIPSLFRQSVNRSINDIGIQDNVVCQVEEMYRRGIHEDY
jgi:hypothetical protein